MWQIAVNGGKCGDTCLGNEWLLQNIIPRQSVFKLYFITAVTRKKNWIITLDVVLFLHLFYWLEIWENNYKKNAVSIIMASICFHGFKILNICFLKSFNFFIYFYQVKGHSLGFVECPGGQEGSVWRTRTHTQVRNHIYIMFDIFVCSVFLP